MQRCIFICVQHVDVHPWQPLVAPFRYVELTLAFNWVWLGGLGISWIAPRYCILLIAAFAQLGALSLSPIVSTCITFLYFSSSRYVVFALVDIFLNYLLNEGTLVDPRAVVPTAAPDLCWRLLDRRMEISRPRRSLMTTRDAPYGFFLFSHLLFESPN